MDKMDRNTKTLGVALVATAALAFGAIGCSAVDDDRDRCSTSTVYVPMFFSTVDRHFHYGSPTGKTVPHYKLPKSARNTPGYKPVPGTSKPPVNKAPKTDTKNPSTGSKPNMNKPAPAPRPAPAPAPRTGRR